MGNDLDENDFVPKMKDPATLPGWELLSVREKQAKLNKYKQFLRKEAGMTTKKGSRSRMAKKMDRIEELLTENQKIDRFKKKFKDADEAMDAWHETQYQDKMMEYNKQKEKYDKDNPNHNFWIIIRQMGKIQHTNSVKPPKYNSVNPLPAYLIPFSQPKWVKKEKEVLYDVKDCYKCYPDNCDCEKWESYKIFTDETFAQRLEALYSGDKDADYMPELKMNRGHRPDYVKDQAMYAKWAEYQESQEKRRKLLLDLQARREDEAKRKRKIQEEEEKKKGPKRMGVEGEWWWLEKGLKPSDMHTCFKGGVTHPIYLRRSHNSNLEYKGPMHTIGDGGGRQEDEVFAAHHERKDWLVNVRDHL